MSEFPHNIFSTSPLTPPNRSSEFNVPNLANDMKKGINAFYDQIAHFLHAPSRLDSPEDLEKIASIILDLSCQVNRAKEG